MRSSGSGSRAPGAVPPGSPFAAEGGPSFAEEDAGREEGRGGRTVLFVPLLFGTLCRSRPTRPGISAIRSACGIVGERFNAKRQAVILNLNFNARVQWAIDQIVQTVVQN